MVFLLSMLIGTIILFILLQGLLIRPITKLKEATHSIAGGNLEVSVDISSQDEFGSLARSVCHMRDSIAERTAESQEASEQLRENARKFRSMIMNLMEGFYSVTMDGKLLDDNNESCHILGLDKNNDHVGIELPDFWQVPEERKSYLNAFKEKGIIKNYIVNAKKSNGEKIVLQLNSHLIKDEGDRPIGIEGTLMDITERKQAEEMQRKLEEQIQHTQKMESLGVLAGGIAHDFNNILMGIMGNISLAQMKMSPETIGIEHLSDIEVAAKRAAALTNQMLAYSGKGQFIIKALDLSAVVEEMTHLVKSSISKSVDLKLDLDDDLPSIEGDPTQVRQIVMNLITNASDAVTKTSGIVSITTGAIMCDSSYLSQLYLGEELPAGMYVFIEVSDTGSGMDKETVSKIFDPFFSTKDDGHGLGLSAVLGIIRGHRGGIEVYSEPGSGTTFKVFFPASAKDAEEFTEDRVEHEGYVGKGTILVVDDEESVLDIASSMLKEFGFDVLTASDGHEALQVFGDNTDEISLILMDLTMPRMGGIAAFHNLRQLDTDVKIILSSGYDEQDAISTLAGEGLADFIQKPYRMEQLISKIRKVLEV